MKVSELLNENNILLDVEAKDKYELIDKLIDVVANSDKVLDKEKVRNCVYEREKNFKYWRGERIRCSSW